MLNKKVFRATLVWTDPPGNPNASVKLVNDLDLIVKNLDTGEILYGNNIPPGSDFTQPILGENTASQRCDQQRGKRFLNRPLGNQLLRDGVGAASKRERGDPASGWYRAGFCPRGFRGRRVTSPMPFTITSQASPSVVPPQFSMVTNGVPRLHERVGANSPLLARNQRDAEPMELLRFHQFVRGDKFGELDQWHKCGLHHISSAERFPAQKC
jgi:hypothetical protein